VDKNNFFDGMDWKERKAGQPFFAHITIIETHKGVGGRWPGNSPSPNWWTRRS
jgi:hypothetical protein